MQGRFANIIVDISHEKVDRPFQYRVPEALSGIPEPGMRVRIPFGSGNNLRTGYIIEMTDEPEFDVTRLKEIHSIIEEGVQVEGRLIRLAFWMKEHYGSTMINALKTVLPVKQKLKQQEKKEICLRVSREEARAEMLECERKHQRAKARVLQELIEEERLPQMLVARKLNISPGHFSKSEGCRADFHQQRPLLPESGKAGCGQGRGASAQQEPAGYCGYRDCGL